MSNKLDRFFRDKLEGRDLPEFDEAYWQQAEELIDRDRRQRRRFFAWYWLFGLGSLLLGGLALWTLWPVPTNPPITNATAPTPSNEPNATVTAPASSIAPTATPSSPSNSAGDGAESAPLLPSRPPNALDPGVADAQPEVATPNASQPNRSPIAAKPPASAPADADPGRISPASPEVLTAPTPPQAARPPAPATSVDRPRSKDQAAIPLPETVERTELDRLAPLMLGVRATEEPESLDREIDSDPPSRLAKWTFALEVFGDAYPAATDDQWWLGGGAGLGLRYRWLPRWSVRADLLYEGRRGQFGTAGSVAQRRYTFGLAEKTFELRPQSLHYLDLPIALQLRNGRQTIEAGLSLTYLLGARGDLRERTFLLPWERGGSDPQSPRVESRVLESGWLDASAFRTWRVGALLAYRYHLSRHWSLALQARYRVPQLVVDRENPQLILRESGPLQFRLGLSFYPFAK
ncbi:MAG: outer membrane beta-barrel protein [Bacteroidota bacterium]